MLKCHELRVKVRGDQVETRFYQRTRGGNRLVGVCVANRKDKDAVRQAIVTEHAAVLVGDGKRGK